MVRRWFHEAASNLTIDRYRYRTWQLLFQKVIANIFLSDDPTTAEREFCFSTPNSKVSTRSHEINAAEKFSFSEDEDDQPAGYTSIVASPLGRMHVSDYPAYDEKLTDMRSETLSGFEDDDQSVLELDNHSCHSGAKGSKKNSRYFCL
jgi:hypothetical protein